MFYELIVHRLGKHAKHGFKCNKAASWPSRHHLSGCIPQPEPPTCGVSLHLCYLAVLRKTTDHAPQTATTWRWLSAPSCRSATPVVTRQVGSLSNVNDTWEERMNAALVVKSSTSMSRSRHTNVAYVCAVNETLYGIHSIGVDRGLYLASPGKGEYGWLWHIWISHWQRSRYCLSLNQGNIRKSPTRTIDLNSVEVHSRGIDVI